LLGFGFCLFALVGEINVGLLDMLVKRFQPPVNGFQFIPYVLLSAYHAAETIIKLLNVVGKGRRLGVLGFLF